jgi:hypothetical protein
MFHVCINGTCRKNINVRQDSIVDEYRGKWKRMSGRDFFLMYNKEESQIIRWNLKLKNTRIKDSLMYWKIYNSRKKIQH